MSVTAIILAAGKSTRMKSNRPKVLHEICGKPMLGYVFDACFDAGVNRILAVVGHGKDEVIGQFDGDKRIQWVEQTEQLGTGHAARMCEKLLREEHGDVFILAGDGPLIRGEVLRTLLSACHEENAAAGMATAMVDNPSGYGRIVRDDEGNFLEIVEELDCTPQQREIHEVFPSYYCIRSEDLLIALGQLTPQNKKNEYYLTDVFSILRRSGKKVIAVQAVTAEDVLSINTRRQLAEVDAIMQDRIQRRVCDGGATIVSPINTYIEADVTIGPDTVLQPFSFVGRGAGIGAECVIGPMAMVPREGIVPEGTVLSGTAGREAALG